MPKYIVRYGMMRSIGVMGSRNEKEYRRGMEVVVRTERGVEIGQVLCEATDDALSHLDQPPTGQVVRQVMDEDLKAIDDIDGARQKKLQTCQKHIDSLGLDMKLVDVESLFGGERLVVFYLSDQRVDFRELVKLLASEYQTRIEMKQIGVRDEAKLLADYGDCGKPVCCNNHLVTMPPVSMKMAKLQKATLDPTKISGRCGRLKCCLRYEFDTYEEISKQLPRVGSMVVTRNGKAKVLKQQIIAEQLLVETEDHRRILIDASEVLSVIKKSTSGNKEKSKSKAKSKSQESGKSHGGSKSQGSKKPKETTAESPSSDQPQKSSRKPKPRRNKKK